MTATTETTIEQDVAVLTKALGHPARVLPSLLAHTLEAQAADVVLVLVGTPLCRPGKASQMFTSPIGSARAIPPIMAAASSGMPMSEPDSWCLKRRKLSTAISRIRTLAPSR